MTTRPTTAPQPALAPEKVAEAQAILYQLQDYICPHLLHKDHNMAWDTYHRLMGVLKGTR